MTPPTFRLDSLRRTLDDLVLVQMPTAGRRGKAPVDSSAYRDLMASPLGDLVSIVGEDARSFVTDPEVKITAVLVVVSRDATECGVDLIRDADGEIA